MSYYSYQYSPSCGSYEYAIDNRVRHPYRYEPTICKSTRNYNSSNDEAAAIMYLGSCLFTPVRWVLSFCC